MNNELTLIKISDAPGHLPEGYVEEIYIDTRPHRIGTNEENLITQEKFKVRYDDKYEQRLVQAIVYDKYRIEFLKKENFNAELIQYAREIVIYPYDDNTEHHAKILSYSMSAVSGSDFQKITIEYADTYEYNYYNGSVVSDYLRSDKIVGKFDPTKYTKLALVFSSSTYNFYSPFYSEQYVEAPIKTEEELNGVNILTRIAQKYKRRIVIYCNESDASDLHYYGNLCNGYNGTMSIIEGSTSYDGEEAPEIEVTKEPQGIDLYKIEIKLTTNVIDFNPYSVTI